MAADCIFGHPGRAGLIPETRYFQTNTAMPPASMAGIISPGYLETGYL